MGLKTIIMPRRNEADLEDLPDEVVQAIHFIFVDTVDEVLDNALVPQIITKPRSTNNTKKGIFRDGRG